MIQEFVQAQVLMEGTESVWVVGSKGVVIQKNTHLYYRKQCSDHPLWIGQTALLNRYIYIMYKFIFSPQNHI